MNENKRENEEQNCMFPWFSRLLRTDTRPGNEARGLFHSGRAHARRGIIIIHNNNNNIKFIKRRHAVRRLQV